MRPTRLSTLSILAVMSFLLVACSGMRQMVNDSEDIRIEATPEILEVHSDSIEVEIRGQIPENYMKKRAHIRFEPTLYYGEESYPMQEYVIGGEDASDEVEVDQTVSYDAGGSFTIQDKFAFEPNMRVSNLCMVLNIRMDSDYETLRKCYQSPNDTIAVGTKTIARTAKNNDNIMFCGQREPERLAQEGKIMFEIERSNIRQSEKQGESLQRLWEITETPELFLNRVNIHSYASPDGPTDLNERLSQNRESNTYDFLKQELLDLGFEEVHDTDFYSDATREDWEGFENAVRADQDVPERDWVLSVIESNQSLDEKEDELKENEEVWEYLADEILPNLRRSDISLQGQIDMRDLPQVMELGDQNPDSLNKRELLVYAYNQETLEDELEVHEYYADRFEEDWIGHGNIARMHLLFMRRDGNDDHLNQAGENLDKALDIAPREAALLNNRGVWYRWKGDYHNAKKSFESAREQGADVNNNMGITQINLAEYDEAVTTFPDDQCDYNTALAYMLNGNNDQALDEIECITDKEADVFYLRAVIAARQGDEDQLTTSLTRAIENDDKYRDLAEDDIEFAGYRNSDMFQSAIQ